MNSVNQITFVIPAYGESLYLKECIDSLKSQTIPVEIIIATATPNSYINQIAKEAKIPLIINNNHQSIADDWNFALNIKIKSKLLVLAHQDDLYLNVFAEEACKFFSNNKNISIAFTDSYELMGNKMIRFNKREIVKKMLRSIAFIGVDTIQSNARYSLLLGFGCPIPCPSVVFNRENTAAFRFDHNYSVNLDWAAWSHLAFFKHTIGYIKGPFIAHRIHGDAQTQIAIGDSRRVQEDFKMFSKYWPKPIAILLSKIYRFGY